MRFTFDRRVLAGAALDGELHARIVGGESQALGAVTIVGDKGSVTFSEDEAHQVAKILLDRLAGR